MNAEEYQRQRLEGDAARQNPDISFFNVKAFEYKETTLIYQSVLARIKDTNPSLHDKIVKGEIDVTILPDPARPPAYDESHPKHKQAKEAAEAHIRAYQNSLDNLRKDRSLLIEEERHSAMARTWANPQISTSEKKAKAAAIENLTGEDFAREYMRNNRKLAELSAAIRRSEAATQ